MLEYGWPSVYLALFGSPGTRVRGWSESEPAVGIVMKPMRAAECSIVACASTYSFNGVISIFMQTRDELV
ncbi:hypothetical protein R3P38DRAFT_3206856 [Favolaschia claudopus]|uniref:Uncharacterized protein n=1 Tax=Favolaschia claudopus TaxID=2862362 RepID=A0AAW0AKT4_9AGAR